MDERDRLLLPRHRQLGRPGAQTPSRTGQYALVNLLYYPRPTSCPGPRAPVGPAREFQGRLSVDDVRIQFSAKFSFNTSHRRKVMNRRARFSRHARRRSCALVTLTFGPRRRPRSEADINAAMQAAYAKYKDLKEGKNADYIPALAKVDSEDLRHRPGHPGRQGLHRRRHQVRGLHPVDLQGLHDGEGHGGAGPGRHRKTIGVDATGMRFNSIVAVEWAQKLLSAGDQPARQPRRDRRHQHAAGREPGRDLEEASSASTPTSPDGRSRSTRRSSSRRPTPTSATRPSAT